MATPDLPVRKFNIYSGILKAYTGADGKKRLKTVASSTIKDRAGDEMTPRAIQRMAESAKDNMTIFLNHKYLVPEDVFGSVEDVAIVSRGEAVDLEFDIRLNAANDRAVKTYEAIEAGTKLGTSIGAQIPDGGATKSADGPGWVFDDIELLEASIVGIPANPRSWVQYAVKSMADWEVIDETGEDDDEEEEQDQKEPAETKAKVWVTQDGKGKTEITVDTDVQEETKSAEDDDALDPDVDWANLPEGDQAEADAFYAELDGLGQKDAAVDLTKAPLSSEARNNLPASKFACPAKRKYPIQDKAHIRNALARCADPSNDQCGCGKVRAAARAAGIGSKDADPTLLKDETPDAQEVTPTEPDAAQEEPVELMPLKTAEVDGLMDLLKTAMSELVDARKDAADQKVALVKAEQERDTWRQRAAEAQEIVDKIASLPVGRRSGFAEGISDFRAKFSDLYDEDVLRMMERKSDGG